jgi:hypothetical protein
MVLVHDEERHETLAGVRQHDRHRPRVEIEHPPRIEGVAVHADHVLFVDRDRRAIVLKLTERAVPHCFREVSIGLCPGEVLHGHRNHLRRGRVDLSRSWCSRCQ